MTKRQLYSLFLVNLVIWTVGNGLVPLLPVYATQLGANPAAAGNYLAFAYLALAGGAVASGWVSDRLQRRKTPILAAGLACVPLAWWTGRAGSIWALSVLTATLWFCGGLELALAGILTGLSAGEDERGKIFGIISLTNGLGTVMGSLGAGFIADRWGFPAVFIAVAIFSIISPLAASFLTERQVQRAPVEAAPAKQRSSLGRSYYLLLAVNLLGAVAGFAIVFGRSLLMNGLGFGALAIATTGAVGGIVSTPLPFIMGWLSDRMQRKVFLYLAYLCGIASLCLLAVSTPLWHFIIVVVLQAAFSSVSGTVGSALVTDLVSPEALGTGLSLFGAMAWIGGVLGFAGGGNALQSLGPLRTFAIAVGLILIALVLLTRIRVPARQGHGSSQVQRA